MLLYLLNLAVTWSSSFEDQRCCWVSSILPPKAHRWWHIRLGYICSFVCRPSATSAQLFRKVKKTIFLCFKQTNFKMTLKLKLNHPCCHCFFICVTGVKALLRSQPHKTRSDRKDQTEITNFHTARLPDPTSAGAALGTPLEGPLGPFLSRRFKRWARWAVYFQRLHHLFVLPKYGYKLDYQITIDSVI